MGNFWVSQPYFKKLALAGLNSLQHKEYQISVKKIIFDDPFHKKRASNGHFGATDDPTIKIRKFFGAIGFLRQ